MNNVLKMLVGEKIVAVTGQVQDSEFKIETEDGLLFTFYHEQDCCESVYLEDVIGDVDDLIGGYVLLAEESSNDDDLPESKTNALDSYTWTFYRIGTNKGLVVLRFLGESNGYYSESVDVRVDRLRN